jgi:hypothetical protein
LTRSPRSGCAASVAPQYPLTTKQVIVTYQINTLFEVLVLRFIVIFIPPLLVEIFNRHYRE